jgi:predicted ATPase
MKKAATFLSSVNLRNFKAIRDSGSIKLTPLTVFVGNNGSGKSSVIEGLETLRTFVLHGLDAAMQMWRGIEHVRNKAQPGPTRRTNGGPEQQGIPIAFRLRGRLVGKPFTTESLVNERAPGHELHIQSEDVRVGEERAHSDGANTWLVEEARPGGRRTHTNQRTPPGIPIFPPAGQSLFFLPLDRYVERWQFLTLWPEAMGKPIPQTRTRGAIALAKDGSNIAEYLSDIRSRDPSVFEGIMETLRYVLPYATDVQPALTSELERTVYLQMAEKDFTVPGWLLSTGTLRILTLLAVLRHPQPPPLILIEEIENGMDPRTIHLLVDEIHKLVESGRSQVIATTHSPYLLDLLPLSSIVLVERRNGGEPTFTRPADEKEKRDWAKDFGPGQLYTMSRLSRGAGK